MNDTIYIDEAIPQWKGNFHTHTTLSDGRETPEKVITLYKNAGYNFLALSDHELYFDTDSFDSKNFIMLGGIECAIDAYPDNKWPIGKDRFTIHLHGIYDHSIDHKGARLSHLQKIERRIDTGIDSWQEQIDYMRKNNLIVFLNHPRWSRIRPEYMLSMNGQIATEVYNYGCAVAECTGESEYEWDYALRNGKKLFCVATDDSHWYSPEKMQALGGFTMVQSTSLDKASICSAIKKGDMYASSGPVIKDMRIQEGKLLMKFSPASYVNIISYDSYVPVFRSIDGSPIESMEWPINSNGIKFIRAEIIGLDGKKAWSQPIYF
ncbi:MAG: hypothetical protein JNL74_17460 [Fibrobacteres bacterium]|nr:hypothetical protein [Fibrobacterota bacterium]